MDWDEIRTLLEHRLKGVQRELKSATDLLLLGRLQGKVHELESLLNLPMLLENARRDRQQLMATDPTKF